MAYTQDIPDGPNSPSNDQPLMKANTNEIYNLVAVDHVTFNASGAGYHKFITLPSNNSPAGSTGLGSAIYTAPGTANTATSQALFQTSSGTFMMSPIRAFGRFTTVSSNGAVTLLNQYGVTSVTSSNTGRTYTIVLNAGTVTGANALTLIDLSKATTSNGSFDWSISGVTLTININAGSTASYSLSFVVLQA